MSLTEKQFTEIQDFRIDMDDFLPRIKDSSYGLGTFPEVVIQAGLPPEKPNWTLDSTGKLTIREDVILDEIEQSIKAPEAYLVGGEDGMHIPSEDKKAENGLISSVANIFAQLIIHKGWLEGTVYQGTTEELFAFTISMSYEVSKF